MSYWVLILWITLTAADGGATVSAEVSFNPGSRAVCEEHLRNIRNDLFVNGFRTAVGKQFYPQSILGKCETRKYE